MRVQQAAVAFAAWGLAEVAAHPLCLNNKAPSQAYQQELTDFCTVIKSKSNTYGSCCDAQGAADAKAANYAGLNLSAACKPFQEQVACGPCDPFAVHVMGAGSGGIMGMCRGFCESYWDACHTDLGMPSKQDYCDQHATESYWCYPVNTKLASSTTLTPYFSKITDLPSMMVGMFMKPGSNKWWIIYQRGKILEVENSPDADYTHTVLDIQDRVIQGGDSGLGEMGMLGLAFSPTFATTGHFYVNYMDTGRNTNIARFTYDEASDAVDPDSETTASDAVDPDSETTFLKYHQPFENHNGGTLLFTPGELEQPNAPYHHLYILTGDGGGENDPDNNAQDLSSKFGKVLRVRISSDPSTTSYTVPDDNPTIQGQHSEVWAYGLRNPWKCSFDREKKNDPTLWCGDVGQDRIEKVTKVPMGANMGWRNYEATRLNTGPALDSYQHPLYMYCHDGVEDSQCQGKPFTGESVTGGFRYRGTQQADQYGGQYIFADYQQGRVLRLYKDDSGAWQGSEVVQSTGWTIPSLAEDSNGEIYILRYGDGANVYALPNLSTTAGGGGGGGGGGSSSSAEVVADPTPDPDCTSPNAIKSGNTCCPAACGTCTGFGCETRPGGQDNCCMSGIQITGRRCNAFGSPCMIGGKQRTLIQDDAHAAYV
ncbi:Sorbosone dehydrogenase-domain-containing protein [Tribonema minus]|uniref:Sorbosone dehydrogenase-domain-containing protein n=1 Tax=Tribonema minus TaxID=303371 RepID=A0A836CM86_9STRA|nr:Sorbosone dehydrogenase-domain-containing protein [Tribonema minus]